MLGKECRGRSQKGRRGAARMQAPLSCLAEVVPVVLPPTLEEGVLAFTSFVHSFIPQISLCLFPVHNSFPGSQGRCPGNSWAIRFWHFSHQRALVHISGFYWTLSHALGPNFLPLSLSKSCISTAIPQALGIIHLDFPSSYQLSVPCLGL